MLWTAAAAADLSRIGHQPDRITLFRVAMYALSPTLLAHYRPGLAVLASSALFLAGALAVIAIVI